MMIAPAPAGQAEPRVVLSARGLSKTFGAFAAVKNVDLDVHHARVHALIGPNGAGKTTVFNLLTKFLQPTGGAITFMGTDITKTPPDKVARLGLVRSFQISAVFPHLTVLENVRVALQRPNNLSTQFWLPLSSLDRLNARAEELIATVGLTREKNALAADLSYGRKRVLEIATTLALDPKVLLLDEPMAGMGGEDVAHVADLIREVAKTRAVLMVEHNLKVVADICHQVTVLQRGEILAEGDYATVSADPRVRTAYMGTEEA
ncbi:MULTISPECIES: ABC transporter ATP-binding protein [Rhizobium/Agrobacterium group]|jgi:branched-chain amino acid transport system ATP-binding protein|uniref:ABC transporter ATP-binding protein n=2 Tax=Rhizobium/Agrobacterium group TaxID=227290 RepID=A0A1B9TZD7_AGRTU|nr:MULTISPECIES: ABC transporter ATP-binding protein [Rhizobium/Agrobacterium group]AKC09674.1 branched chain amino acid ABC transporter ATPase [Agrobacterium tumefaciens]MDP9562766.1 branched-chain amino acid transport system ATP-binding protein [Rhizobium nepotum]HCV73272.1 ABC transporter ATP-binding protein [Agrobacterium sp.]AYM18818.1 branched-chain amino acid transport system ATP-binding protein [Agrobacterium tumefaciens]AYM70117.1 branched-chain amino acid transport system ATP-binding